MSLKLYNTLTREKEEFIPIEDKKVGLYSCGPTVYDYAHIGNLRTYIFSDILKRALIYNGYKVKHVMNITDVGHLTSDADTGEDKMEKGARRERKTAWEIADFYIGEFKKDIKNLNIIEPNILCRATGHIREQIELIKKLEELGYTYEIANDGIYFDTSKIKDYGKLARLNIEGQEAGARVEMIKGKRNITDFALWKFSPKDQKRDMEWDSPWGPSTGSGQDKGFPGWHIECSAMSMKYLGENFDIHTGGIDHVPVHHTNEIAQSEAVTEKKFVNFWLHGEFLTLEEGRMGKSEGNLITLNNLIDKGFNPLAYRYLCLTAHYRSKLNFNWQNLEAAGNALDNLYQIVSTWDESRLYKKCDEDFEKRFLEFINNDLDMPKAIALVWELVKSDLPSKVKKSTLLKFDEVFGLGFDIIKKKKARVPEEVWDLVSRREEARKNKDWQGADELRKEIEKNGFLVEDTKEGPKIKIKI
jgi:cysteinyl-tRNA synthetase